MEIIICKQHLVLILIIAIFSCSSTNVVHCKNNQVQGVTYDPRSLLINGKRDLLFSGSIHYTRSTPEMWPDLLSKAKQGGLNVIQTYVFWNVHEPVQGQYNFEGQYDLVKFIKLIAEHGMHVTLRVGPFIEAEWNFGGFPFWLKEINNITFRTDNPQFKNYMEKFVKMTIEKMKSEKLFASQGGPIILTQIENEYNTIESVFGPAGASYVQWAGNMAEGLNTGVPWIMCKQTDAPPLVINTCNGRHCGDTFTGPNSPNKPSLWTENWTAQYRVFGDPPPQRAVEDIAFSVARWFSKNGTLANYYMYHGGTNFGRTSSSFVTTRYYDEAPLDEFGLEREPKFGHLRDLHRALKLCEKPLLWGTPRTQKLGDNLEARIYEQPGSNLCAAFLANNNSRAPATVKFNGQDYYLPQTSISILPDCKTVVYNTMMIVAQHNSRKFVKSEVANKNLEWEMFSEKIPSQLTVNSKKPLELYGLTKDTTDYAWYTTQIELTKHDMPLKKNIIPVLRVASLGHSMLAFVNGEYVGSAHGSFVEKSFVFQQPAKLKTGANEIAILGSLVGLPDSGVYMEKSYAGPRGVTLPGLNTGTLDVSYNGWGHKVGLDGEKNQIYTKDGAQKVQWTEVKNAGPALTWYKAYFDEPEGSDPVVVKMHGMGKGMIWINGNSIGRYWMSYVSPLGKPSQSEYHVPRSYLRATKNLIVILEEEEASPSKVEILTVNRNTICTYITEDHPATVKSWARKGSEIKTKADEVKAGAHLKCPNHTNIKSVQFASFGDPSGYCGDYQVGKCDSPNSKNVVEQHCLGKSSCSVPINNELFNKNQDPCPDVKKILAVQVKCGH